MQERPVALVTGGARRLGALIAETLAVAGYDLAIHAHASSFEADQVCERIRAQGANAWLARADLMQADQARGLIDEVLSHTHRLDLLVASAANYESVALGDVDDGAWSRALDLNLRAPWLLAQRAASALRQTQGSIVLITCMSVSQPFRNYLPYVVSKGGLHQLMRVLSLELGPDIRVNSVAPGTVLPPADLHPQQVEQLREHTVLKRVGGAADVARAVLFLAQSQFITGQEIVVDAGRSLL